MELEKEYASKKDDVTFVNRRILVDRVIKDLQDLLKFEKANPNK